MSWCANPIPPILTCPWTKLLKSSLKNGSAVCRWWRKDRLVGIITVADILSAFISMMGMFTQSSRLDVKISAPLVSLQEITQLLQDHGAEIISICNLPTLEGDTQTYTIRLKKIDLKPILAELKAKAIEVVSFIA